MEQEEGRKEERRSRRIKSENHSQRFGNKNYHASGNPNLRETIQTEQHRTLQRL